MEQVSQTCARLGIKPGERLLAVRISTATLQFFRQGELVRSYVISTSKRPPSNIKNSLGTPRGLHEIAERIGAGQPPGMVFKARQPTGKLSAEWPTPEDNLITSRILWLDGLEPGLNKGGSVDSHDRFIYIHGTANERSVGTPTSMGCIRMCNADVIKLYDAVPVGALVVILDN